LTVHPEGARAPANLPTLGKVARHSGGCGPIQGNEGATHADRPPAPAHPTVRVPAEHMVLRHGEPAHAAL